MRIIYAVILVLNFLPTALYGMGLGEIKIYSYHNEPLDAEIELIDVNTIKPEQLVVKLASVQEFKEVALRYPAFGSQLQFEVDQKKPRLFIKVSTTQPIKQSLIELLINLSWPEGRMSRGYTALLETKPADAISMLERRAAFEKKWAERKLIAREKRRSKIIVVSNPETLKLNPETLNFFGPEYDNPEHISHMQVIRNSDPVLSSPFILSEIESTTDTADCNAKSMVLMGTILIRPSNQVFIEKIAHQDARSPSIVLFAPTSTAEAIAAAATTALQTAPISYVQNSAKTKIASIVNKKSLIFAGLNRFLTIALMITGTLLCIILFVLAFRRKKIMQEQLRCGYKQRQKYNQFDPHASKPDTYSQEYFSEEALLGLRDDNSGSNERDLFSAIACSKTSQFTVPPQSGDTISDTVVAQENPFKLTIFSNEFKLKFNLAVQYLDIGDQENALHLLEEVFLHGNPSEKEQAKILIDNMNIKKHSIQSGQ